MYMRIQHAAYHDCTSASLTEPSNRNFQRQSGGDDAGIEANGPKAAEEAGMFDLATAVHDHFKAAIAGDLAAILTDNAELEPQHFGFNLDCLSGDVRHLGRRTEDVDDIDGVVDFVNARIDAFAKDSLPGLTWVNGNNLVAIGGEIDRGEIAGMVRIRRQADHRDGTAGGENAQAVVCSSAELRAIPYGHFSLPYLWYGAPKALLSRLWPLGSNSSPAAMAGASVNGEASWDFSSACPKSHRMSSTSSMPIDNRIISGPIPQAASSSSVNCWCVVVAG